MNQHAQLLSQDIHSYLKSHEHKSLLRFITCGSVDDGKSTLIGRLLYDSKLIFEDQLATLTADSKRVGTQGAKIDYALLMDGLQAEREQGITIDVAYRYFATDVRKFIVADTPGHEQYTRNMVTGASTAQVAVILVDARKGILTQTRRHSYLVSLVGIRQVVLAINKMDLVGYSAARFAALDKEYRLFAANLGFDAITAIPISALEGDNVLDRSPRTFWYTGPTLMEHLETVQITDAAASQPFRMRVQWVNRPDLDFRGFAGTITAGVVRPGDAVVVTASGQSSRVARIVTFDGDLPEAAAGQAVTLTLTDEIDISRGDLLASPDAPPAHSESFRARLVWLHEKPLTLGRSYLLKAGATTAPVQVACLDHKVNVNSLQQESGNTLTMNEVGVVHLGLSRAISFDRYQDNRATGSFILIDRLTNATVAAGMIEAPLEAATGVRPSAATAAIHWLTGAEAPEVALQLSLALRDLGHAVLLLDAMALRADLNRDLGTSPADQQEETRRLLAVARLVSSSGQTVLVSALTAPANTDAIQLTAISGSTPDAIEQLLRNFV